MQKRLIIGLGCGRCGTQSLAMLLGRQRDTVSQHEMMPVMPRDLPAKRVIWRARYMLNRAGRFQGDVAFWYLPHVRVLAEHFPEVRFVTLEREVGQSIDQPCDDYYQECRRLEELYPTIFRSFDIETLNTEVGLRAILTFCGYENPRIIVGKGLSADGQDAMEVSETMEAT